MHRHPIASNAGNALKSHVFLCINVDITEISMTFAKGTDTMIYHQRAGLFDLLLIKVWMVLFSLVWHRQLLFLLKKRSGILINLTT